MTTLSAQASALRHIHSIARRSGDCAESILHDAAAGIRTIDWLRQHPDVVKAVARIFDAFPGVELVEVREHGQPD